MSKVIWIAIGSSIAGFLFVVFLVVLTCVVLCCVFGVAKSRRGTARHRELVTQPTPPLEPVAVSTKTVPSGISQAPQEYAMHTALPIISYTSTGVGYQPQPGSFQQPVTTAPQAQPPTQPPQVKTDVYQPQPAFNVTL